MYQPVLQNAYQNGGEVIVQLKMYCGEQYKGQILDLAAETFNLFHSGPNGGMLWTFKYEDIAFCGQVIEMPTLHAEAVKAPARPAQARGEVQPEVEELE